jgi:glycosyltransferase involved in cell wall biosynthesis
MLAERPVVATAAGGALEIIQDGVSGLLVPPGDADALACAVAKLRDDAALRSKLVRGGFLRAKQFFSLESMLTGVSTILQRACLRRAAVSRQAA